MKGSKMIYESYKNCKNRFLINFVQNANTVDKWKVFYDFLELSAIVISNRCDNIQNGEREARYCQIINEYSCEKIDRFCTMLACVIQACRISFENPTDFLGEMYYELGLYSKCKNQFITLIHINSLIAYIQLALYKYLGYTHVYNN